MKITMNTTLDVCIWWHDSVIMCLSCEV